MQTAIGPIIPIGTICDCQSDTSGKRKPCTVEDYEIHNNRLFHKVRHMLPNGEFFGGGIVEGRCLVPKDNTTATNQRCIREIKRERATLPDMSATHVSSRGKTITIVCDDHDTKDALLNALTYGALSMTTLRLTDRKIRIMYAALHELDERLRRGLANSHLHAQTARALRDPVPIHESEVSELMRDVMFHVGGDSL